MTQMLNRKIPIFPFIPDSIECHTCIYRTFCKQSFWALDDLCEDFLSEEINYVQISSHWNEMSYNRFNENILTKSENDNEYEEFNWDEYDEENPLDLEMLEDIIFM